MKILVLSDSHGQMSLMEQAVRAEKPDEVFHLGDHIRDAEQLERIFPGIPITRVVGNCDYFSNGVETIQCYRQGTSIFATHGHRYQVKFGYLRVEYAAREAGAQVVLFGHTHEPYCRQYGGLWLLNPGTCGGKNGSYGLVIIENDIVTCKICKGETS